MFTGIIYGDMPAALNRQPRCLGEVSIANPILSTTRDGTPSIPATIRISKGASLIIEGRRFTVEERRP
ncbi:MAG: hypothetical protein U0103_07735 [Candidatus Obscuribacterales bacterium]